MTKTQVIVPAEKIESRILLIRGQKARDFSRETP